MKRILAFLALLVMMASSVYACHCTDTDQTKPASAPYTWGDNGALGGTARYYLSGTAGVPEGCTGTYGNYVCNDICLKDTFTLREFYCSGSKDTNYIYWHDYADNEACGYQVPEFGVVAGAVALVGALGIFMYRRK
jgi:hypothetical protein